MNAPVLRPHFTPREEVERMLVKFLPGKMRLFDSFQKLALYQQHVPFFYTMLTPLFQVIYGSNNIHGGYFETGDEDWVEAQHNLTRLMGKTLGFRPEHKLLEVGCGIGGPAVVMAQSFGSTVVGLNITMAHIRRARMHVHDTAMESQVSFVHGNALQMPFIGPMFDHAYAIESVSHMPDKARVIGEVARVTRPKARFGIIDACAEDPEALGRHPDYNFFNVTWGVRAEEWIRPGEIAAGFAAHGFRLVEERDLSPNLEGAPLAQAGYARERKDYIVELYGEEVFEMAIRALEIADHYVKTRLFTYKMWVGEKES